MKAALKVLVKEARDQRKGLKVAQSAHVTEINETAQASRRGVPVGGVSRKAMEDEYIRELHRSERAMKRSVKEGSGVST